MSSLGLGSLGGTGFRDPHGARGYKAVAALVVLVFVLLLVRLWHLQVLRGDSYYEKTADNVVRKMDLPASRGEIRDRNGKVLVENRPAWNAYVIPRNATDAALVRVANLLHLGDEQLAQVRTRAAAKKGPERAQALLIADDIGRDAMALLVSDKAELPGIIVEARPHRSYRFGPLAAHVLGYMNQISSEELAALRDEGYHPGDYVGRGGVERQWESYLRGKDGFERIVVDARGRQQQNLDPVQVAEVVGGPLRQDPVPGDNLVLTIDSGLQTAVEKALGRFPSSAAAVVEVATGRVLALASHPAFDPNVLTGHLTRAEGDRLQADPYRPLIDKAVREIYFPGSTFKIIPALAALEDNQVNLDEEMLCTGAYKLPGHTFHCMEVHGRTDLHRAIVESCNIFFHHLGERIGLDRMAHLATDFGFGAPTGIGLPGEAAGFIPTQEYYKSQGGFRSGYTLNTAIGQGSTKTTVLQIALAYAALASGGDLYVPQLVNRIETPSGKVVQSFPPRLRRHLQVATEHIDAVRSALCGVVNEEKGTAYMARDDELPFEVCGKTGTAQVKKTHKYDTTGWDLGNAHAWFASYAPPTQPGIAVAVLVEHGGLGGHIAAPIAMDIYRAWFKRPAPRTTAANAAAAAASPAATQPGARVAATSGHP